MRRTDVSVVNLSSNFQQTSSPFIAFFPRALSSRQGNRNHLSVTLNRDKASTVYKLTITAVMVDLGVFMADLQCLWWLWGMICHQWRAQLRNLEMDLIQDKNKSLWNGLLIGHSAPSFIVFSHDLLSLVRGDTCTRMHTRPTHIHGFRRMHEVDPQSGIWMQWAVRVGNGGQYVSWDRGGWILHCGGDETWRATGRWRHWGREQAQPNALLGT